MKWKFWKTNQITQTLQEKWDPLKRAAEGKSLVTIEQLLNLAVKEELRYNAPQMVWYDSHIEWVNGMDAFKYTAYLRGSAIPFGGPVRKPEQHVLIGRGENQSLNVERS